MQLFSQKDFTEQPWKNGKGKTYEIAKGTEQGKDLWRLSLALMQETGPFSVFPDQERILTVVSGNGISLQGESFHQSVAPYRPFRFSGAIPLLGACLDGPVKNLNLMYDPRHIAAEVHVGLAADLPKLMQASERVLIHLLDGDLQYSEGTARAGDVLCCAPSDWANIETGAIRIVRLALRRI